MVAKDDISTPNAERTGRNARNLKRTAEIVSAAIAIFSDKGYANTSMQDIAESVGMLKGSLYHFIDSKEDLLFRACSQVYERSAPILDATIEPGGTPLEAIGRYVRLHTRFTLDNAQLIGVYYREFRHCSAEHQRVIRDQRKVFEDFIIDLIEQARLAGEIPGEVSSRGVAMYILGAMNWIYLWYRPDQDLIDADELPETYARLTVAALSQGRSSIGSPMPRLA
ncbi:MAG: hypothetical protein JWQ18_590 [Conexibacter sp.]|nr:hypothetical protein [Conexibacter sp.]